MRCFVPELFFFGQETVKIISCDFEVRVDLDSLTKMCDSLIKFSMPEKRYTEVAMSNGVLGLKEQDFFILFYRFCKLTVAGQSEPQIDTRIDKIRYDLEGLFVERNGLSEFALFPERICHAGVCYVIIIGYFERVLIKCHAVFPISLLEVCLCGKCK